MVSPFEPPGERDLPGGDAGPPSDAFVARLRSGERDAFVRFFRTYRLSVFSLVRCLVPTDEAAAVTSEAFVAAYRQVLLDDGAIDLEARLYRAALAACRDHAAPTGPRGEALSAGAIALSDETDLGRRFGQALRTIDDRLAVTLLLHDVHGLRLQTLAQVLGLSVDAARALLFKSREAFLAAFEATEPQRPAACRLAEQVAAGGVGRPAADAGEIRRLREHASYCAACRRVTRSWRPGALGLALVAARPPLPAALQATPVFVPAAGPRREAAPVARVSTSTSTHRPAGGAHGSQGATAQTATRSGAGAASERAVAVVRAVSVVRSGPSATGSGGMPAAGGSSSGSGQAGASGSGSTTGGSGSWGGGTGAGGAALGGGWSGGGRHGAGGSSWSWPCSPVVQHAGCLTSGQPSRPWRHRSTRAPSSRHGGRDNGGGGGGHRAGGRHGWGGGHSRRSGSSHHWS